VSRMSLSDTNVPGASAPVLPQGASGAAQAGQHGVPGGGGQQGGQRRGGHPLRDHQGHHLQGARAPPSRRGPRLAARAQPLQRTSCQRSRGLRWCSLFPTKWCGAEVGITPFRRPDALPRSDAPTTCDAVGALAALIAEGTAAVSVAQKTGLTRHGVAAQDFYDVMPEKFQNKTNGVTPRRWLAWCNPALAALITEALGGDEWINDATRLAGLRKFADDRGFQAKWRAIKHENKERLAAKIKVRRYGPTLTLSLWCAFSRRSRAALTGAAGRTDSANASSTSPSRGERWKSCCVVTCIRNV